MISFKVPETNFVKFQQTVNEMSTLSVSKTRDAVRLIYQQLLSLAKIDKKGHFSVKYDR